MQLLPLSVKYHLSCVADICSESIIMKVVPLTDTLDVGEDYVFCTNLHLRLHAKNREQVEATVTIRRSTADIRETLIRIGGDKDSIGRVDFYPPRSSDESWSNTGPSLNYSIYLNDQSFELLADRVKNKNEASEISISIANIDWGWEPDGSRQEWKLDPDSKRHIKPLDSFDITFKTQEQTVSDVEAREQVIVRKEYEERNPAQAEKPTPEWAEFLARNKIYFWIIIGAFAYYILRR
jgi:hypothetical protein